MTRKKTPGKQRRGLMAPASANACSPGSGWHVYNGQALGFMMGRRWVDWVFVSPSLTKHEADQVLGKAALHLAFLDQGQYQELAKGWRVTQHVFQGSPDWFIVTRSTPKCAYIATSRDLFRSFGIRTIRGVS